MIKNLDRAIEASEKSSINVSVSTAVQAYNIFQVPELINYFREKNLSVYLDLVHQPTYLSLGVLSSKLAEDARLHLQEVINYPGVNSLIELLNSSQHHEWEKFIAYTKKLDDIHGQDISKVIPELGI